MTEEIASCSSGDVLEGRMIVLPLDHMSIAIARVDGVVYAFDNTCPHRGGELGRGDLVGHLVHCPLHAWCFDVRTGVAAYPAGSCMARYAAIETNGRISVQERITSDHAPKESCLR